MIGQGSPDENRRSKSASLRAFFDRSTPICSTMSSVSRDTSRIDWLGNAVDVDVFLDNVTWVPSISVTIAFFFRRRLLRRAGLADVWTTDDSSRDPLHARSCHDEAVLRRLVKRASSVVFSRMISVVASSTSSLLRIVDIDFDLGQSIEDLLACC